MQLPVSLEAVCEALPQLWSPQVIAKLNGQFLKAVRVRGEFPWHAHANEDEMFLVLRGELRIGRSVTDGGDVHLRPGECFVVPKGVRHCTAAVEETWLVLFEPATTSHTGDEVTPMTRSIAEQLGDFNEGCAPACPA